MTALDTPVGSEVETIKILSNGKWETSSTSRFGSVFNPSSGKVIAKVPYISASETAPKS